MENSVMLNAVCSEPVSLKVVQEPFYRKGFSPFVHKQTGTWWEYDDDKKGFFDTGIIAQGRDGNDYVITEQDYNTIVERTLSNVNPTLDEKLSTKLPKSPANWEPWTADEQAAARARTGAYHVDLIGTVETKEEVSNILFSFEARSADRIIAIIEMPPVSIAKSMNISITTDKGSTIIVQFGSGDQSTSQMRCFMSDTILLGRVAVSHNGSNSTNTSILSGTDSVFINNIDKESISSVNINNPIPLPIGTKVSLYMGA